MYASVCSVQLSLLNNSRSLPIVNNASTSTRKTGAAPATKAKRSLSKSSSIMGAMGDCNKVTQDSLNIQEQMWLTVSSQSTQKRSE